MSELEGGARLAFPPSPLLFDTTHASLEAYLAMIRGKVKQPRFYKEGDLAMMRVPRDAPGAEKDHEEEGYFKLLTPEAMPAARQQIIILGGSAAYGFGVPYAETFFGMVEARLRRELGSDDPTTVVLARPAWELLSQVEVLEAYLARARQKPAAVVIYAGNNEAITYWKPPRIGLRPFERSHIYRLLKERFKAPVLARPAGEPYSPEIILGNIWRPEPPMRGAGFWTSELQVYLDNYRRLLLRVADMLRQRGIPLVLVTLPLNLSAFEGEMVPQPVTYREVGATEYARLEGMLREALSGKGWPHRAGLEALIAEAPRGPLQLWTLAQKADREGKYGEALQLFKRAKDSWWGIGFGMISMGKIVRALASQPGIHLVDTQRWFDGKSSVNEQTGGIFMDICHLDRRGHKRLARDLYGVLHKLLDRAGSPAR